MADLRPCAARGRVGSGRQTIRPSAPSQAGHASADVPGGRLLVLRLCATVVEGWRPEFDANFNYANEGRGLSRSQVGGARAAA